MDNDKMKQGIRDVREALGKMEEALDSPPKPEYGMTVKEWLEAGGEIEFGMYFSYGKDPYLLVVEGVGRYVATNLRAGGSKAGFAGSAIGALGENLSSITVITKEQAIELMKG